MALEKQRTRELLIYSGLRPDQQAWMEGALSPGQFTSEARLSGEAPRACSWRGR